MSRKFVDAEGAEWWVELNVDLAITLKETLGIDVLRFLEGDPTAEDPAQRIPPITRLDTDYILLASVIYCLCEEEAKGREIPMRGFYRRLTGPAFKAGRDALMGALADFFLALGHHEMAEAIAKQQEVVEKTVARTVARLKSPEFDRLVDAEIGRSPPSIPGTASGKWPASSESTPDP